MNNAARKTQYVQVCLAGLCLAFVLVLIVELNWNYGQMITKTSVSQPGKKTRQTTTESIPPSPRLIGEFNEIIERPLFMSDRRPFVAANTVAAPDKRQADRTVAQEDFMLSAVIITGEKRIALLQSKKDRKLQKLHQGDELDGWMLKEIQPSEVFLTKGSKTRRLELMIKKSNPQADPDPVKDNKKQKRKRKTAKSSAVAPIDQGSRAKKPPNTVNKPENPVN